MIGPGVSGLPAAYYDDAQATLLCGDALAVLRTLPSESVHACVTSPPYFGLRSYLPNGHADKPLEIGREDAPDAYVARLVDVFHEVRRNLRSDGTLWLNIGDSYAMSTRGAGGAGKQHTNLGSVMDDRSWGIPTGLKPKDLLMIPARVALALQADGWWLRADIIWSKAAPMPESVTDRPTSAHEHVFLLAKRATYFFDADAVREAHADDWHARASTWRDGAAKQQQRGETYHGFAEARPFQNPPNPLGRNQRDVWHLGPDPYPEAHFATFPREIPRRAILAGTSEAGCCPHCGAPWRRVVERHGEAAQRYYSGASQHGADNRRMMRNGAFTSESRTLAWEPACTCPEHAPVPCTVLDPFVGSGTTCLVAKALGRKSIGIDLNAEYLELARRRCQQLGLLFSAAVPS